MKERQWILIVEDQVINRRLLHKILSDKYNIVEAENGAQAWKILMDKKLKFDAILLDIIMPVMNGYEFLEKIKQASMTELPIIVMTGESDAQAEQKALDMGAWDFVNKPYNPKVLFSRLRNAMARRQVSVYERMQKMSAHDQLTGLHNRGRMFEKTRKMIDENPDVKFIFARTDIDRFALYNSAFGEEEGNKLLCYLAQFFVELASTYTLCTYGRISADIFCACVPYRGSDEELLEIVDHMQEKLAEYRRNYLLEISVGVYIIDDPTLSVEEFYLRATMGAQKCKSQYGKHIGYYDETERRRASEEILIANEMQKALDEEQFVVYLQPKYDLSVDEACGAEALVRWVHPEKGLISPGYFIPVFERNGFIAKLDYYVWEKTCQMIRSWLDAGREPFPVSVNISRISLYNPQLVEVMVTLVEKYQFDPALLQLEITESAYMTSPELMQKTIHTLRGAGFTILMDDFGSGYSSLNTLKEIEVDILKIDMKFLPVNQNIEKGEIILASMIKMANWLGMSVVVEGVETRKQRDFLEGAGCNCVQGYYYSKPIPQKEYEEKYVFADRVFPKNIHESADDPVPKHNVTILVVDDVEMDRSLIREYFKEEYHVHPCSSAEEALIYLKYNQRKVRLILVDNVMPGMSGMDFLTYCQDVPILSDIPKIMITANEQTEDQVNAFLHGAFDYITKPLVKEIVIARVNHVMDISRQYRAFENWEFDYRNMAERDGTTGLLNKTAFLDMMSRMMLNFPEDGKALLIFDFDDFKGINDQYGHLTGDVVIKSIADILSKEFRKTDLVGRFGGDEFMVLMSSIPNREIARRKATEIIKTIGIHCAKNLRLNAGISAGIAFSESGDTQDTLFARADEALYEAKKTGKGRVVIYGEKVPPVIDDDKPLVLICGDNPQLFPAIALAYGGMAAFVNITSYEELQQAFEEYSSRISVICMDMQQKKVDDAGQGEFYQYILEKGGGEVIPILAICEEGNMKQMREALELEIEDILTLPPHIDVIQRRLSRAIIGGCTWN